VKCVSEISIEVETRDQTLIQDLFGNRELSKGETRKQLSAGVILVYDGGIIREAFGWPFIEKILIRAAAASSAIVWDLVAAYLFKFLEERDARIRIAGKEIPVKKDLMQLTLMESARAQRVEPLRKTDVKLTVVNVVATSELGQSVDLAKLVGLEGFLYDQAIYNCAYLKDRNTKAKVSVFATGKMISVGTKSLADSEHDLKYAAGILVRHNVIKRTKIEVKLRNIVATTHLGTKLDLEKLTRTLPNVIYRPEQFPAAIYHAKDLEAASVLIFSNGKIVFAGLRNTRQLKIARDVAVSLIMLANSLD